MEFNYHLLQNPMKIWGPEGWGGGGLHSWVNFCWVCATGLSEHLPHYRAILWPNIDSILATFGKMSFSRSQWNPMEFNYHLLQNPMKIWGPEGWGGGGLHSWVNFCWVCATGLSEHLPHYRAILWPNIDSILATFGKMSFSRSQLGHNFLFTRLP